MGRRTAGLQSGLAAAALGWGAGLGAATDSWGVFLAQAPTFVLGVWQAARLRAGGGHAPGLAALAWFMLVQVAFGTMAITDGEPLGWAYGVAGGTYALLQVGLLSARVRARLDPASGGAQPGQP